ncbi:MAG TPA: hypothetical protein VF099_01745 [Ktedonobacterales bacterium]
MSRNDVLAWIVRLGEKDDLSSLPNLGMGSEKRGRSGRLANLIGGWIRRHG